MNNNLQSGLLSLWKTATKITEQIENNSRSDDDKTTATAVAWVLPGAELFGLYSIPMDKIEMYVVRLGNFVVGSAGIHPISEYPPAARHQKLVAAPCRLRPVRPLSAPSSTLAECLSRTPCLQELDIAA